MPKDPPEQPAQKPPEPSPEQMADFDLDLLEPPAEQILSPQGQRGSQTLAIVETAFLASTSALIWLINFYFPLGAVLRIIFSIPIALAFLRWNRRTAWMTTIVASLLLSVLMGPPRSLQFLVPHGLLGVLLGGFWRRRASWWVSLGWGTLLTGFGFFFQVALLSLLQGDNLWVYFNQQMTGFLDWILASLGVLTEVNFVAVQFFALLSIFANALLHNLAVHLVAWYLFERVGSPIPPPPAWLQNFLRD